MPTIKQKHAQAAKDFETLVEIYGDINDFCGAYCNTEQYILMLKMPTPSHALKHLEQLIEKYFAND
ncbi:MAG: hypothetical protein HAW67_01545 [Endozoicomonadaceae bacterium]|nr:hypothetical protein [Endozoicomonadaceae bacterium]